MCLWYVILPELMYEISIAYTFRGICRFNRAKTEKLSTKCGRQAIELQRNRENLFRYSSVDYLRLLW